MPTIVPIDLPSAYWREKAQRAQRAGQYGEAVRLYRAALRKHDDNALRRELAQVFCDMRSYALSNRLYLENLALDAKDSDSLYGLARNYSLLGDENGMADLLDLYLRMAPAGKRRTRPAIFCGACRVLPKKRVGTGARIRCIFRPWIILANPELPCSWRKNPGSVLLCLKRRSCSVSCICARERAKRPGCMHCMSAKGGRRRCMPGCYWRGPCMPAACLRAVARHCVRP